MNGLATFVFTFIIWITAKGELDKYASFITVRDIESLNVSAPGSAVDAPRALPELPPLDSGFA